MFVGKHCQCLWVTTNNPYPPISMFGVFVLQCFTIACLELDMCMHEEWVGSEGSVPSDVESEEKQSLVLQATGVIASLSHNFIDMCVNNFCAWVR